MTNGLRVNGNLPYMVPEDNDYAYYQAYLQLAVKHVWKRWSIQVQLYFQHLDSSYDYDLKNSRSKSCLDIFGGGLGANYHWLNENKWLVYSGAYVGLKTGKGYDMFSSGTVNQFEQRYHWMDYQVTVLGFNYEIKKWGLFVELGYGTVRVFCGGISYELKK